MHLNREATFARWARCLASLLALAMGFADTAHAQTADEKLVCVRAVEHAQLVRLDGKLREAREGFMTCARAVCPDAIREDCTRWVVEVDASLPSVVFDAVWPDGRDATGMTVTVDGRSLAGAEKGRAVTLDPGEHAFRFEVPGAAPIETRNVIREGEKNRILRVTFTPYASPARVPLTVPETSSAPSPPNLWREIKPEESRARPSPRGPIPVAAFVLGGVGVIGFGGFAFLGLNGLDRYNSIASSSCAPAHTCSPSDQTSLASARNEVLVGDILGCIGLAAAGAALWLVLTRPDVPAHAAAK